MTKYYTSVGRDPRGDAYIATITIGHPNRGDDHVTICDVTRCRTVAEGQEWAKKRLGDPAWHRRVAEQSNGIEVLKLT